MNDFFKKEKEAAGRIWKVYLKILIVFWIGIGVIILIASAVSIFENNAPESWAGVLFGLVFIALGYYVWKRTHPKTNENSNDKSKNL